MPKVYMLPRFGPEAGQGGIKRVCEAMEKFLPAYGVEFVDSPVRADLAALHGTETLRDSNIPTVLHSHGWYWSEYEWAAWAHKANAKLIHSMKRARAVTVPSFWVANSVQRGTLIDPYVVPHGIDIDEWHPLKSRGEYCIWAKNRVDPVCDPTDMNKLATMATGVQFVSTFGNKTDNVTLLGAMPLQDIKPYIQNAALYIGTTRETGAITVLEALASGVPVLGWNFGANSEIIIHRVNGWLSEPGDYNDLFEGLVYCRANLKELSANARESAVNKFQWKDVIGKYADVYNLALQEPISGPAVSVIVTAYNLQDYLPACIESVLSQDYNDWELLVVDDCSPDNCGRIAEEYAEKDSRIKVIHNRQNLYLAEARNTAIRQAKGRYITALDADDQMAPGALKTLAESLDRDPEIDIVTGAMELIEQDGKRWVSTWPPANPNYSEQIAQHNQVPYSSMYRRWVWERLGGYRRRCKTAEDAEFWTRAMSFGAVPAKVTNLPTLIYSNRPSSMSHKEPAINWTDWFPWKKYPDLTPCIASGEPPRDQLFWGVNSCGPVEVSVVIPCGPEHDWYLQDALDSLVAQTFLEWECIIVNDTGRAWFEGNKLINPYLAGFPWAKVIDSDGTNHGVAWARTTGTMAARAPLVFYLDADDFLQPAALDVFVKTQRTYGGWVYSDWYDQNMQVKKADDWNADGLTEKMLGPMTGLYPRDAMLAVMFEDFGGWEDWDAQLSLLERGICGTHVTLPLFVYRYNTGTRREDNYKSAENLLQYIHTKHSRLYKDGEFMAGCRKCGGGGGKSKIVVGSSRAVSGTPPAPDEWSLIEYVGPMTQFQQFNSKLKPGDKYRFGGDPGEDSRKFYVHKGDVPAIVANANFVEIPIPSSISTPSELPVLEAHTREAPAFLSEVVEVTPAPPSLLELNLSPETLSILKAAGYDTIDQLKMLSIAQLVSIKGIGATRAKKIMDAVKER